MDVFKDYGIYKEPGIYKGSGIYKGAGIYKDESEENWSVIYKTYFENYDSVNNVDTPEVGQQANYVSLYGNLTYDTLEYKGVILKCISSSNGNSGNDSNPNTYYNYGPVISLPDNIKKLKIDTIINAYENRNDFSSLFCGSLRNTNEWGANDFFLDPQFDWSNPKQFGPFCGWNVQYESGWESGGFGSNWLKLPASYNGVSFKRTYIHDYKKNEKNLETYINDELAAVGNFPNTYKKIQPRGYSRNSGHIIKWTGIIVSVLV